MADRIPKIEELLDFRGKTIIVTGASGGIGAGIVRRFAEAGANLIVHYRSDKSGAAKLVKEIGARAVAVGGDLTRGVAAERLMAVAVKRFGRIDAVINNAAKHPG